MILPGKSFVKPVPNKKMSADPHKVENLAIKTDPQKLNLIGEKYKFNLTKFLNFQKL